MEIEQEKEEKNSRDDKEKNNSCEIVKRRYIKKSKINFMLGNKLNLFRSAQLHVIPLYEWVRNESDFVLIGGDFIYRINGGLNSYNSEDSQLRVYKDVIKIIKQDKFLCVSLTNKFDGIIDFRSFISTINQYLSILLGESHLDVLLKLQISLQESQIAITRIIELYNGRQEELIALQVRRRDYIKEYGLSLLKKNYEEDDFLMIGMMMIDFDKKLPTLKNLIFNHALVSLIGSDFEQLQQYFLRKGVKEFFDFNTRVLIQSHSLRGLMNHTNEKFKHPFALITYDDLRINCFIEVETVFIDLPQQLKYDPEYENPFLVNEGGFLMKIIVPPDQILDILEIRHQNIIIESTQDTFRKEEDIGYNIQSQYLLEKFYSNQIKQLTENSPFLDPLSQEDTPIPEPDPYDHIRCKYRFIQ